MTEPDRRPFWRRHPGLLIAIVVAATLSIMYLTILVRGNLRLDPPGMKPRWWHHEAWHAFGCFSPVVLVVLLALAWRRRLGRIPDYLCGQCGYDRRGVPDLSPCPECGAPTVGE